MSTAAAMVGLVALAAPGGVLAWSWPAGGDVLKPFSVGADPYAGGQHRGVDVAAEPEEAVLAPARGTVTFAGTVATNGKTVTITTSDGYAVTLTHLGEIVVRKGEVVSEDAAVGRAGSSGAPEWSRPYVHLGIRVAMQPDGYLDPLSLLPPRPAPSHEEAPTSGSATPHGSEPAASPAEEDADAGAGAG